MRIKRASICFFFKFPLWFFGGFHRVRACIRLLFFFSDREKRKVEQGRYQQDFLGGCFFS